ncbi:carph-isopro domain-containing protein [Magnetospirillum sp. UT-4]|uniref:carph-isopro domain-containing protein n=1 Tax=Magnetospirillum sp. UT-4 TaxID=2681467 RepID=UPI00352D759F
MQTITFDDLVRSFGGPARMAETLGLVRTAIPNWRRRGRIPPSQWAAIVDAAEALGIPGVSYDALRHIRYMPEPAQEVAA